jgi:multidrug resistance efflux pump
MASAEILPFPARPSRSDETRLRAALASLDAALAEQRAAIAEFRESLGALGGAVTGLGRSLDQYAGTLATTKADLHAARESAQRLETTADGWLTALHNPMKAR